MTRAVVNLMPSQNFDTHGRGSDDPALVAKASMGTLEPPEDKSIKTLIVRGPNLRIVEQEVRDQFGAYGEIESIRFLAEEGRAFFTYTSREGAEKASQELSKMLVINGQRLAFAWARPQVPKPDHELLRQAEARRRFFLSQRQKQAKSIGAYTSSEEVSVPSTTENDGASSSNTPIICNSSLNLMTRAGVDYVQSDSIFIHQRTKPPNRWNLFRQRYRREPPSDQCTRVAKFPCWHEMPSQNINTHGHGSDDPALVAKASMGTLEPPEDKSIKTLLVRGLNLRIVKQEVREQFGSYGEIESIIFWAEEEVAFITYTSREGAEKATQELGQRLVINGQRLILAWARLEVWGPDDEILRQTANMKKLRLADDR